MHRHTELLDDLDTAFDRLLATAVAELGRRQAEFQSEIARYDRWDIDEEAGLLRLTSDAIEECLFAVTPIGTYLPETENWAWAWANDAFTPDVRAASACIRRLAEETGYRIFERPSFRASLKDLDELTALALQSLEGRAVFKVKNESPWVFYAVL